MGKTVIYKKIDIVFIEKPTNKKFEDLTGKTFNHLTVLSYAGGKQKWWCECDCEQKNIVKVSKYHLKSGHTKSCRCIYFGYEKFIRQLDEVSPNRTYIIKSEFKSVNDKIIVEDEYGECEILASHLLRGHKTGIFNALDKDCYFIKRANLIHNFKYTYTNTKYVDTHSHIFVTCELHSDFLVTPHAHTSLLLGCSLCSPNDWGFGRSNFIKKCNELKNLGTLYIIRCWNEFEEFYKIGITSQTVKKRYKGRKSMPYNHEIIYEFKSDPELIFNLEKQLFKNYWQFKFQPNIWFNGNKECFNASLQLEEVKEFISKYE